MKNHISRGPNLTEQPESYSHNLKPSLKKDSTTELELNVSELPNEISPVDQYQ